MNRENALVEAMAHVIRRHVEWIAMADPVRARGIASIVAAIIDAGRDIDGENEVDARAAGYPNLISMQQEAGERLASPFTSSVVPFPSGGKLPF